MKTKNKTKSPIKEPALRRPGQSLDEELDKLINEKAPPYIMAGLAAILLAVMEWVRYKLNAPPVPWLMTLVAFVVMLIVVFRIKKMFPRIRALKLGRAGEIAVGQMLEEKLRPLGYKVFHDVIGNGFNADHVVIGENGVFVVETKTHSKPPKGNPHVKYDGHHITINGFVPERNPVEQVKAASSWISNLLREATSKSFQVQPIITYPGWWVEEMPMNVDVWVLNEKAIPPFIAKQKKQLNEELATMAGFHLKRYIIAREAEQIRSL